MKVFFLSFVDRIIVRSPQGALCLGRDSAQNDTRLVIDRKQLQARTRTGEVIVSPRCRKTCRSAYINTTNVSVEILLVL